MNRSSIFKMSISAIIGLGLLSTFAGCSKKESAGSGSSAPAAEAASKVNGIYYAAPRSGSALYFNLEFKPNGKVAMTGSAGTVEGAYEVDGNNVKTTDPKGQRLMFVIDDQGCIDAGSGDRYCHDPKK